MAPGAQMAPGSKPSIRAQHKQMLNEGVHNVDMVREALRVTLGHTLLTSPRPLVCSVFFFSSDDVCCRSSWLIVAGILIRC